MTTNPVPLARFAVLVSFAVCGLQFATFASRLVLVRQSLGVSPAVMGLLLLVVTAGSVVIMPRTGHLIERFSDVHVIRAGSALAWGSMLIATVCAVNGWVWAIIVPLFFQGLGIGAWDVSQNVAGTRVEQAMKRSIMPQFHAAFSWATLAGAGVGWVFSRLEAPLLLHVGIITILGLVAVEACTWWLLPASAMAHTQPSPNVPHAPPPPAQRSAWREPRTLLIGAVMLSVCLTEGSANDWITSAIVQSFHTPEATGIACLSVFLASMSLMRTLGTRLIDRWGRVRTLRLCGVCAIAGLLTFGLAPWLWVTMIGAVVWGFGAALGFPVGISAASDDPLRAAQRTAVVSTIGYVAFLAGPPLLGLLADAVGFRNSLMVILIPAVLTLILAGWVAPLELVAPETASQDQGDDDDAGPRDGQADEPEHATGDGGQRNR